MSKRSTQPVTALDYRYFAERRLPRFLFDYVDGGANDERTLLANERDFDRFPLKQRVMRDVSSIDISTRLGDQQVSMPMALAPIGLAGMMARRGEAQAARAAERSGIPFTLSTVGICPLDEIRAATQKPFWFQLYMLRNRELVESLVERAADCGCETLVFTVDLPVAGMRHRDVRNHMMNSGFSGKLAKFRQLVTRPRWLLDVGIKGKPHTFGNLQEAVSGSNDLNAFKAFVDSQFDPTVTWKDIEWLRSIWKGRLLIKGVLSAEDARAAVGTGADGVIVSNHGGRQLDGVSSSIAKLPEVVSALEPEIEVLMDGGVRSGVDVVKAIALGADGVLIGRPWVWAMAARGEQGIVDLLNVFKQEIEVALALMGISSIDGLSEDLIESA